MASLIGKALAKRTLKDAAQKNINSSNPFEEQIPVYDKNGRETGKTKTRKRGFPTGLSQNDLKILKKVRKRAYRLDMSLFNCCGIRFGWSSVIGIIPVIGDFIDCFMALMVVKTCQKIDGGLPATLRARMMFNIVLDFGLGLIPLLGDIADAVFRANTRNAWLLEMYLTKKMEAERVGHVSDPELGTLNVPPGPGTALGQGTQHTTNPHDGGQQQQGVIVNQPEPARVHARQQPAT
ncbi:PH domain containing protein [Coniochaeta hoffmannii]|uniref:PH domain containing protein n=1 Tax=Coniochaeta hoffmannii TaxID=91930 RepID=A0AA38S9Z7_9PEZI|nr:PH domain containing protein [Coniochaeta hoffmannii]